MGKRRGRPSRRDLLVAGKAVAGAITGASLGIVVAGPVGGIALGLVGALGGVAEALGSTPPEDDAEEQGEDEREGPST